jgi:hypothetical protein
MNRSCMSESLKNIFCLFCVLINLLAFTSDAPASPSIAGCPVFSDNNVWNSPIETLPADPNSQNYIETIGSDKNLHPDFGSGTWDGGPIGIPYTIVGGSQAKVSVSFDYADESDPGLYPIPADALIEGGPASSGDRHVLIIDKKNCMLYELFAAYPQANGTWQAGSGAIFDLRSNALRPSTWTSADAAGLPILPGLVRYDEVASGEIKHAIRFTASQTRNTFIWPARHYASSLTGKQYPPMGQRFRLKATFNISGFSSDTQVILRALKKYGMILADNGSSWFISGVPDPRWNNDVLHEISLVSGSEFEAIDESSLMVNPDSGQTKQTPPVTPSSLAAKAISSSGIVLTWKDNSRDEDGFQIYRKEGVCDSANMWSLIMTKGANITSHTNTGLKPSTTYSYRVRAYNAGANSDYSNCASTKTALSGTPKAPTNLTATSVSASQIRLIWTDNSTNEKSFKVYRRKGSDPWALFVTKGASVVSHTDNNASGNTLTTTYSYYVRACNSSGCSPKTNNVVVPYKPTNLTAAAISSSRISLTWTDKSSNETGFEIYGKSGACTSTNSWNLIKRTGPNITSYVNTGLSSGPTYSYRTRAYTKSSSMPYAYGYSHYSNCKSAITP